jgi:hypothetical protein
MSMNGFASPLLRVLTVLTTLVFAGLPVLGGLSPALAESEGNVEKEAFDAAKELGTIDAWNAFLATYSQGFHADLARAYIKKLSETSPATANPAEFPFDAGTWGGIVRKGEGQNYGKQDVLQEGETVSLMGKTETLDNGYPWFKIWYGPDQKKGFMWGGILCSKGPERPDLYKTCPVAAARPPAPPAEKHKDEGCSGGRVLIEGKCVRERDVASFCGPGYHRQGSRCVSGGQPLKPQKQLSTGQQKALSKGCPKGLVWSQQEGCHEDD